MIVGEGARAEQGREINDISSLTWNAGSFESEQRFVNREKKRRKQNWLTGMSQRAMQSFWARIRCYIGHRSAIENSSCVSLLLPLRALNVSSHSLLLPHFISRTWAVGRETDPWEEETWADAFRGSHASNAAYWSENLVWHIWNHGWLQRVARMNLRRSSTGSSPIFSLAQGTCEG